MQIITVTVQLAFEDYQERTAESVRRQISRYAVDGLEAECVRTSVDERYVETPDIDFEQSGDIERWQDAAYAEFDRKAA